MARNSQMGEYGEEGIREGNGESAEWGFLGEMSQEVNSESGAFENKKYPVGNLENISVLTGQSPVCESEVKVKGNSDFNNKVDEISSAEKECQKDEILEKQYEREDSSHEEQREDESLGDAGNRKQDIHGEGKYLANPKGDSEKIPKDEEKGKKLDSDDESQQELNPGYSQLRSFRGTVPDGLSLLKPHQSDNLSAITEENSNLGDESTNRSFTEDEKDAGDPEVHDNEGKET